MSFSWSSQPANQLSTSQSQRPGESDEALARRLQEEWAREEEALRSGTGAVEGGRRADVQLVLDAKGIVSSQSQSGVGVSKYGGKGGIVDDEEMGVDPAAASQATR